MNNLIKKITLILGLTVLITIIFRGWIYRNTISYNEIGRRSTKVITNQNLKTLIDSKIRETNLTIEEIIEIADHITNKKLKFRFGDTSVNPNKIYEIGKSNCIGYSALFNSIVVYLIKAQKLEKKYQANHLIGKLDFLGVDLHKLMKDSFFRDHDYNEIINLETGEKTYIDPSVSDYLQIRRVNSRD